MDALPEELLRNVLNRLSIKSIGSCMCVNKNLHSVIKNPCFVSSYTKIIRNNNQYLMFWTGEGDTQFELHLDNNNNDRFDLYKQLNLPLYYANDFCYYFPVCNGIICLRKGYDIILWNPTIRKSLTLPQSNLFPNLGGFSRQDDGIAFWFDSMSNDYKLVRFFHQTRPLPTLFEVFSLNNNHWKLLSHIDIGFQFLPCTASQSLVVNGTVNWIGFSYISHRREHRNLTILSFDVKDEVFQTIELPDFLKKNSQVPELFLYKETSIALCCSIYDELDGWFNNRPTHPEVWVMKEYGNVETWTKLWHYDESQIPMGARVSYGNTYVIGLLNNGQVLWTREGSLNPDAQGALESHQMIISTDAESGAHNRLAVFPRRYISCFKTVSYFEESLVLLDRV